MDGMIMRNGHRFLSLFFISLSLLGGSRSAVAQEDSGKPTPPVREFPPLIEGRGDQDSTDDQPSANDLTPDRRPLTGLQSPTLGSQEILHSYWIPGFQYTNLVQSAALNQPTASSWNSTNYVVGNLSLLEAWSHSQLAANYSGGSSFSSVKSQGTNNYQRLGLVQDFAWRRWQITLINDFSYLPQSPYGFGAGTNLATPGVGGSLQPALPGLQMIYQPMQTVFTSIGPQYTNSVNAQIANAISPRSVFTVAGSYGILRFVDPGNIDTNDSIFTAGYSYSFSRKDTIGILYRFSSYRFTGQPQAINDHIAQLAYGRKITGRLALQLFGGPEMTVFRLPVSGSTNRVAGAGGANLNYGLSRSSFTLGYNHGVNGGGGQFTGSTADQLQAGMGFQLTRVWKSNLTFGYARNRSLGIANSSQASQAFDSWFSSGALSRPLGRTLTFAVTYIANIQASSLPVCAAGTCDTNYLLQQISVGLQWHARPFVLR
jgi:hypothetical protein